MMGNLLQIVICAELLHFSEKSSYPIDLKKKQVVKKSSLEITVFFNKGANRTKCHNCLQAQLFLSSPSSPWQTAELGGAATFYIYNCSYQYFGIEKNLSFA